MSLQARRLQRRKRLHTWFAAPASARARGWGSEPARPRGTLTRPAREVLILAVFERAGRGPARGRGVAGRGSRKPLGGCSGSWPASSA